MTNLPVKPTTIFEDRAIKDLFDLFKQYRVDICIIGEAHKYRDSKYKIRWVTAFAQKVLIRAGYTPEQARWIVLGIPKDKIRCEYENPGTWGTMYDAMIVQQAVDCYIRRVYLKDEYFEVGFDLAEFDKDRWIETLGLEYIGLIESAYSMRRRAEDKEFTGAFMDVYKDAAGNLYSAPRDYTQPDKNKFGDCYYHGFLFQNAETAFKFVRWVIAQEDVFVKEFDLLINGFGGIDKEDWEANQAHQEFLGNMGALPAPGDPEQEIEITIGPF